MMMKLICQISELISVWADDSQYVVRIKTTPKQSIKHASNSYFPTLEMCFEEVFEYLCRNRLADGRDKEIKEVAEIIIAIKEEITNIMRPFTELDFHISGSAEVGRGRETND